MHISDCCQFSDIHISQGSVATYLRCGGIFKYDLLQIYQWVCQWKNFENRLTFGEVMGKSLVSCFLRHSVEEEREISFYFSDSPFWFSGTMPSYCMTVLWRRRRSKVHSSLIFVLFVLHSVIFFIPWELSTGVKNKISNNNGGLALYSAMKS